MNALRKAVIAASALLCGIAASGASFEKAPIEFPGALPVQLSLPFVAVPADALTVLDPLAKVQPAISAPAAQALVVPAGVSKVSAAAFWSSKGSSSKESSESQRQRLDGQFDGVGELPVEAEFVPPSTIGTGGVVKAPLPNPAKFYEQAYEEAVYQASRKKIGREGVTLREVTASMPSPQQGPHLSYAFDARGKSGKAYLIYVDFAPHWAGAGQRYGARVSMSAAPQGFAPVSSSQDSQPATVARVLRASPDTALRLAREKAPGLGASLSFAVRPSAGGRLAYHLFDGEGWHVAVDARIGASSVVRRPALSDSEIRAAAAEIAKYKGMPWSHSEYDGYRINAAESLRRKGATEKQLKLFESLLAKAPILGGRFNPWAALKNRQILRTDPPT